MKRSIILFLIVCLYSCTSQRQPSVVGTSWVEVMDSGYRVINNERIRYVEIADTTEWCNPIIFITDSTCTFDGETMNWSILENRLQIGDISAIILEQNDSILKVKDDSDTLSYLQIATYKKVSSKY